jgi:hypothetical protein
MARPSTAPIRKQVGLPERTAQAVEHFRFANRFKTESDAIRRLIELGLDAAARHETIGQ